MRLNDWRPYLSYLPGCPWKRSRCRHKCPCLCALHIHGATCEETFTLLVLTPENPLMSHCGVMCSLGPNASPQCLWRRFIASQAGATKAGAQLCSGFPAEPLHDDSTTLEAAGLCNAVVTQR